jgi:DNA-binding transcriptional ArsR family regulator
VSGANEEIYSIMFSSLKHPARRKILRILSNKPMIFSEMLELLQISSSNLTYHLENLGELITKDESGAYKLSTFGVASVNTMEIVEDAPPIQPKQRLALPFKWKTIFTALLIGLITLASITYLQFGTLNRLSDEQEILQSKYNQLVS